MAIDSTIRLSEIDTPDNPPSGQHRLYVGTDGKLKKVNSSGTVTELDEVSAVAHIRTFGITIDGGGSAILSGVKGYIAVPFDGTITGWTLTADQTGSIVIDVWKDTYANYPPDVSDTIAGSEKPTISSDVKGQDLDLTTWTTAVAAGDVIGFNVDSCTDIQLATLVIQMSIS